VICDINLTIDPKDAKDFDDALSFKKLGNGNYEIEIILMFLLFRREYS
jgi:hypothetical protein